MRHLYQPGPPLTRRPEERPQLPIPELPPPRRKEASADEPKRGVVIIPIMEPEESRD